jgi:hypothetical protein
MQPLQNPPLGSSTNPQRGDIGGREKKLTGLLGLNWDLPNTREKLTWGITVGCKHLVTACHSTAIYIIMFVSMQGLQLAPSFAEKEISQLEETAPLPQTVHTRPVSFLKELSGTVGI